jgi:hypothetical protein
LNNKSVIQPKVDYLKIFGSDDDDDTGGEGGLGPDAEFLVKQEEKNRKAKAEIELEEMNYFMRSRRLIKSMKMIATEEGLDPSSIGGSRKDTLDRKFSLVCGNGLDVGMGGGQLAYSRRRKSSVVKSTNIRLDLEC